jgi:hypothetical protein
MRNCYYTCGLLPLDLVVRSGYSPLWLGNHLRAPSAPARRDALSVHPMTCPYVTKLAAAAEEVLGSRNGGAGTEGATTGAANCDCLVVPGGCDAMRRMGDLLAATYPGRVFVLPMPRAADAGATAALAADLARLETWLQTRASGEAREPSLAEGDAPGGSAGPAAEPPRLDYPTPPRPGGVFLVSGPLSDDSLLRLIDRLGAHVSGLESCTSPDRWKPLAPGAAGVGTGATAGAGTGTARGPDHYEALAVQALSTGLCPRRSTAARRDHLTCRLDETRPTSIIYARQSFCDPGAYDSLLVNSMAQERDLPYLEIEVDFPFDANGPLRTRVEAFLEAQLLDDDLLDNDLFGDDTGDNDPFADDGAREDAAPDNQDILVAARATALVAPVVPAPEKA